MTIKENIKNYKASAMPPKPPIVLTAQVACCENTSKDVL